VPLSAAPIVSKVIAEPIALKKKQKLKEPERVEII